RSSSFDDSNVDNTISTILFIHLKLPSNNLGYRSRVQVFDGRLFFRAEHQPTDAQKASLKQRTGRFSRHPPAPQRAIFTDRPASSNRRIRIVEFLVPLGGHRLTDTKDFAGSPMQVDRIETPRRRSSSMPDTGFQQPIPLHRTSSLLFASYTPMFSQHCRSWTG